MNKKEIELQLRKRERMPVLKPLGNAKLIGLKLEGFKRRAGSPKMRAPPSSARCFYSLWALDPLSLTTPMKILLLVASLSVR